MDAAREAFPENNPYGVFAFGVGPRIRRGRPSPIITLNVYVRRKYSADALRQLALKAVPPLKVRERRRTVDVVPNVIAMGRLPRAMTDDHGLFSGLHAGAAIKVAGTPPMFGGVACLLGDSAGPAYLVTAGHLFPPGSGPTPVFAAASPVAEPEVIGTLAVNLLDDTPGRDAALVELSGRGAELAVRSSGGPPLKDVLPEAVAWNQKVSAFLPNAHDYSAQTTTGPGPIDAFIEAAPRGSYWVRDVIGTEASILDEGDSGSVLCAGPAKSLAVGICVGDFQAQSVFEPMSRALQLFRTAMGTLPKLWSNSTP